MIKFTSLYDYVLTIVLVDFAGKATGSNPVNPVQKPRVVHDLHDHLAGRHRLDDFDADRALLQLDDEIAHHVERDVRFQEGAPYLARSGVHVGGGERAAPRQPVENAGQLVRKGFKHAEPSFLAYSFIIPGSRPGMTEMGTCGRKSNVKHQSRPRAHRAVGR